MHRRARHLTGRAAGASYHYDARWLSLTDGTGVQTLTDLAGSNNATQATSANQPTFKTNILNGNPIIRFDGSNDFLTFASSVSTLGELSAIILFKSATTIGPTVVNKTAVSGIPYTNYYYSDGTTQRIFTSEKTILYVAAGMDMQTSFGIATSYISASAVGSIFLNGVSKTVVTNTISSATSAVDSIGIRDWDNTKLNGDIAALIHIAGSLASSLRKRFEHAIGFSYKITCS